MSDEADATQERMESQAALISKYTTPPPPEAVATGFCLNCAEALDDGVRWCDPHCQADWSLRKQKGRRI
jgi:hypothetical protein